MKANELKRGMVVELEGELWTVVKMDHTMPGKGRAYYQTTFKNLDKGNVVQRRLSGDDNMKFAYLDTKVMEYLYQEGDHYVFMDQESYEQVYLSGEQYEDAMKYVRHNLTIKVQFYEEKPISVDLPASVILKVEETEPSARGDTVKNVTKPAKLETGLEVKVPAHISAGELVKVDTRSGEFLGRVSSYDA